MRLWKPCGNVSTYVLQYSELQAAVKRKARSTLAGLTEGMTDRRRFGLAAWHAEEWIR